MRPFTKHEIELAKQTTDKTQKIVQYLDIRGIRRDAITLRKLFEHSCNGCIREKHPLESWPAYDLSRIQQMAWVDKRIEAVEKRIAKRCKAIGISFYIQSDPRGCSIYLGTNDECRYNTEGIAIY